MELLHCLHDGQMKPIDRLSASSHSFKPVLFRCCRNSSRYPRTPATSCERRFHQWWSRTRI